MNKELVEILRLYLLRIRTMSDCYEWLAGVDWDDPCLDSEMKNSLGMFELLAIEAFEGIRDESEFYDAASEFVAKEMRSTYYAILNPNSAPVITSSSTDSTRLTLMPDTTSPSMRQSGNISLQSATA
jgi:hypothetical protein